MATQELVETHPRPEQARTKNAARRVRASGRIPAIVYGAKKESIPVTVDPKQIGRILHSDSGHNTVFDLKVGNEQTKAMIVDWQYEPIKGTLMHIDLKRIAMDQTLRVSVPVQLTGTAEGVKTQGGILEQVLREVEIECLPGDIPDHIELDVTALVFGQVLRVADLPHSEKIKFVTDENQTVAHITAVKEVVEAAPAEPGVEAAAAPAEPEVIKKGKQETEEVAAEPAAKPEGGKKPEGKK
ncbi:MAG TPA: 50S ribosomal protein L25 [Terriglobales bacterium]|nr:50S ribosomal protein L25 [Terriglobales bacterium]